jgi:hypothetical protein
LGRKRKILFRRRHLTPYSIRLTARGAAALRLGALVRPVAPYVCGADRRAISPDTPRTIPSDTACAVASTVRLSWSSARNPSWRWRSALSFVGRHQLREPRPARLQPHRVADVGAGEVALRGLELRGFR